MTDLSKLKPSHTQRAAFVYIRQSTPGQVEHNRESTARQYALADRACQLGWSKEQVVIVDEDLGLSGSSTDKRSGFARLTSEVALAHVGIVLGLEVSRLARNNADWYRLLELCGVTDTLIGDNDGVYHPALFNDRLLLGLKGTMSEAELHIIRARLDGGIRNKAARGELRRGLPVGFVWGEQDGEVLFHPDEAVTGAIRTVFERFAEFGSPLDAGDLWIGELKLFRRHGQCGISHNTLLTSHHLALQLDDLPCARNASASRAPGQPHTGRMGCRVRQAPDVRVPNTQYARTHA